MGQLWTGNKVELSLVIGGELWQGSGEELLHGCRVVVWPVNEALILEGIEDNNPPYWCQGRGAVLHCSVLSPQAGHTSPQKTSNL